MITDYTKQSLTYSNDILRAISGIVTTVYGERVSYGLLWIDFDRVMLREPSAPNYRRRVSEGLQKFPSWSWASIEGPVQYITAPRNMFSLGYWARFISKLSSSSASIQWLPIDLTDYQPQPQPIFHSRSECAVSAALAWLSGCIQVDVPGYLRVDCRIDEYEKRLEKLWPVPDQYFKGEMLRDYQKCEYSRIQPSKHTPLREDSQCTHTTPRSTSTGTTETIRNAKRATGGPQSSARTITESRDCCHLTSTQQRNYEPPASDPFTSSLFPSLINGISRKKPPCTASPSIIPPPPLSPLSTAVHVISPPPVTYLSVPITRHSPRSLTLTKIA